MDKSLKYYILKEEELVVEVLKGPVKLNEYISFKTHLIEDKDFNPNYSFLIDIRAIEMVFSNDLQKRMTEYLEFVEPIDALSKKKKIAVLTSTPDQVVYTTIIGTLDKRSIDYNIFSTKDSALAWLNIDTHEFSFLD